MRVIKNGYDYAHKKLEKPRGIMGCRENDKKLRYCDYTAFDGIRGRRMGPKLALHTIKLRLVSKFGEKHS